MFALSGPGWGVPDPKGLFGGMATILPTAVPVTLGILIGLAFFNVHPIAILWVISATPASGRGHHVIGEGLYSEGYFLNFARRETLGTIQLSNRNPCLQVNFPKGL